MIHVIQISIIENVSTIHTVNKVSDKRALLVT